ncbi:MAG: hypothetical protein LUH05_00020, partial [Candidatus Gastranaerophilales bacterium]|nr:hypothetical protein [Candidatus Gastranaerophilales bacterium]
MLINGGSESITFSNNSASSYGGAIANWGSSAVSTIINSSFSSNSATYYGGAIINVGGTVTSRGNTYSSNTATHGGAIFNNSSSDTINSTGDTFINENYASTAGGAIYNNGTLNITDGVFSKNHAGVQGGAIYSTSLMYINSAKFTNNYSTTCGGAIAYWSTNSSVISEIYNSTFSSNYSADGGALHFGYGTLNIYNTDFLGNYATSEQGGAISTSTSNYDAYLNISNSTFENNSAPLQGGAISNMITMNIYNSTFKINKVTNTSLTSSFYPLGGAIFLGAVSQTLISGSTFDTNSSGYYGGAIGTRLGNSADNSGAVLDILNSTFTNNTASANGGAIYNTFYNSDTN